MNVHTDSQMNSPNPLPPAILPPPEGDADSPGQVPVFRASPGICMRDVTASQPDLRPKGCCLPLCGLSFPSTRHLCLEVCLNLRLQESREAQPAQ